MIHDATTTCGERLIPYRMRFSATTGLIYMFYYLIYSNKLNNKTYKIFCMSSKFLCIKRFKGLQALRVARGAQVGG